MIGIDKVDCQILEMLQADGRLSNAKVANRLSMSETPCWRRLKRLEEKGVISGYQAVLDRRAIGLGVMVFVQLGCAEHSEATTKEFQKIIEASPNVLTCHNTTGDADFLLMVVAKDLDDYSRFVERVLRRLPGVTSIKSNVSLRELKSSNKLPIDEIQNA